MRKRLMVLVMAVMMVVMSVAPAFARHGGPHRPQPDTPPGLSRIPVDRPDQAPTPDTGRQNAPEYRQNF